MAHSRRITLAFFSPCWFPFAPLSNPSFTYLETLLAVAGPVHLGLRLLVNWPPLSQPFPQTLPPPNSQNPGYQAPHYDDLKTPASSVRNSNNMMTSRNDNKNYTVISRNSYILISISDYKLKLVEIITFNLHLMPNVSIFIIILWYLSFTKNV